jgi:hypothetical protein
VSLAWIAPAAFIGLALIALPVAVHLLVRQHARELAYPSLRFLRETQLAAFRRRTLQDAALLACRAGIVAAAAIALAGPVLQTPARTAGDANRTSRAIVTIGGADQPIATLMDGAFAAATFTRMNAADALADAVRWLDAQPRSAREIVIAGALRRGSIEPADLAAVPPAVGIRFEQTAADGAAHVPVSILARRDSTIVRVDRVARLTAEATGVTDGSASPVAADIVTITARPVDTPLADGALRAALNVGVPWRDFERRVAIVWDGADEFAIAAQLAGAHVIRMPVPAPPSSAADAVLTALTRIGRPDWVEPMVIPQQQLDSWSRRPGAPSLDAPFADEGDRRWLWGVALVLLGVEWWLRRGLESRTAVTEPAQETRVA